MTEYYGAETSLFISEFLQQQLMIHASVMCEDRGLPTVDWHIEAGASKICEGTLWRHDARSSREKTAQAYTGRAANERVC